MKNILEKYKKQKEEIKSRLEEFKNLKENKQFQELLFCLITPQSNAQRCWQAIEQISKLKNPTKQKIFNILKTKTRFHKTKTNYILNAEETWQKIKPLLKNLNIPQLRENIAQTVKGFGLKESSHFLRNIGLSNNEVAILDRHILKNLQRFNLIKETEIKSQKHYLQIEKIYLNFANSINIPADELDMLWWSQENGGIFK